MARQWGRIITPFTLLLAGGLVLLAITACEEEQHRAAGPETPGDTGAAASEEATPPDGHGLESGTFHDMDIGQILPRSERQFFAYAGDVWQVTLEDDPEPIVEGLDVAAFDSNALGNRLAVLTIERDSDARERSRVSVLRPGGSVMFDSESGPQEASGDVFRGADSIAMNPSGDAIAVGYRDGAVRVVTLEGESTELMEPSMMHQPGRIVWSSDGTFISYLDPWMPNDPSELSVAYLEDGSHELLVNASPDSQGVIAAEWVPGTPYIVFIKASGSTIQHGGDLFAVDVTTGEQRLLMSSGEIAPVAGISGMAVSADGIHIAVTGFVPGEDHPEFAGLWLLDFYTGVRSEIETSGGEPVTDLWWLGRSLLYRTIDEPRTSLPGTYVGLEEFSLITYNPADGSQSVRYESARSGNGEDDASGSSFRP